MVCKITKERDPLLPDRMGQGDLFVCDIFDAVPKGDMAAMAHPIFSLSTKPDHRLRRYEDESRKNFVVVKPSAEGLATIHDRDILIYCISQLIAGMNNGDTPSKTLKMKAYDFLKATNRVTDGRGYEGLRSALVRLQGTQIETNIVTGGTEELDIFSIIDRARVVRATRDGRMQEIEVTLSDWVFNAIKAKEVLTYHRKYWRLRKPIERRMYELARKHCGAKPDWKISLPALQRKCGSSSTLREFRRLVSNIVKHDEAHGHIPDYKISYVDETDMVLFSNRGTMHSVSESEPWDGHLKGDAYHEARLAAPGWDVREIEHAWRVWLGDNEIEPKRPERHFIKFCSSWYEKRGRP